MSWIAPLISGGLSLFGGALASSSSNRAASQSSEAQIRAAELQKESADAALNFQREIFGYGQEQDLLARAWAERNSRQNIAGYEDAYQAFQDQFQFQRSQTDYGNQIRNNILGQLNDYSVSGRSQLPGLYQMTGQPMGNIPQGLQAPLQPWSVQTPNLYPNQQRQSVMPSFETFRSDFDSYLDDLIASHDFNKFKEKEPENKDEDKIQELINGGRFTDNQSGGGDQRGSDSFEKWQDRIRQNRVEIPRGLNSSTIISGIRRAMVEGTISLDEAVYLLSLANERS